MTTTSTGDGAWTSVVGSLTISDDVVIAHDVTLDGNVDMTGEFKINSGKSVNTTGSNHNLTVDGDAIIDGTLTGNASAISLGSLTIESGGTYSATSGTTTVTSETSGGYTWRNNGGTFTHNNGTVTTNSSVDTKIRENTFYNLIINQSSSGKFVYWEDTSGNTCTVANDLTITTGRLRGLVASDTVTVTGDVTVSADGTFNHTSVWTGSINHGSLTIASGGTYLATSGTTTVNNEGSDGVCIRNNGTFTHNSGLVTITREDHTTLVWVAANQRFNNLTVNLGASSRVCTLSGEFDSTRYVEGDLTVTNSKFDTNNCATFRIDGDVSLTSSATLTCGTSTCSFGSMSIASGTTLSASSGTTTITGKESGACFANSGTFTHNKGKVSFTKSGGTWTTISNSGGQSFYDVNVDSSTGTGIYTNDPLTILNNFTLVRGTFIANDDGSHDGDITVHGLTSIGGGANATKLENDGRTLQLESVTVLSNGTIDVAEGTNNFGGIRNVGGTIS